MTWVMVGMLALGAGVMRLLFWLSRPPRPAPPPQVFRPLAPGWPYVTVAACDRMDGLLFEHVVVALLPALGWTQVQGTRASGDFGADVLATDPAGVRWAIQCKRYRGVVGVHAVQEVLAAQRFYATAGALLLTTGRLTRAAREMARRTGVAVWDRDRVAQALAAAQALAPEQVVPR
jgi:hypothetical protein